MIQADTLRRDENDIGEEEMNEIRERLMAMTDDPHMKSILSHMGTIDDPTFIVPPDIPLMESDNVDLFGEDEEEKHYSEVPVSA